MRPKSFTFQDFCNTDNGGVAQLGERLLCTQEVIGSIPFTSTIRRSAQGALRREITPKLIAKATYINIAFKNSTASCLKERFWLFEPKSSLTL
jgi:hypothetical protein